MCAARTSSSSSYSVWKHSAAESPAEPDRLIHILGSPRNMRKRILLDTDPGIDDACAILLALASPELCLEGLSVVHGNCSLEQATKNALAVLELAHAGHIPVAAGCRQPLVQ